MFMHFKNFLQKMRGDSAALPPAFSSKTILIVWLGGFIAIAIVTLLTEALSHLLILGSFGASCVIIFGYPDSPFAQPRNVIGGHFLSSLVGLLVVSFLSVTWWTLALAVATAIAIMMFTKTVHPPQVQIQALFGLLLARIAQSVGIFYGFRLYLVPSLLLSFRSFTTT
jgi:CBS-domain-containing membrane protein